MANAVPPNGHETERGQGAQTLVIGCGFIGSHIVGQLAVAGERPVVLTRSRPSDDIIALLEEGNLYLGDATDPELLSTALKDINHVVFSAGGLLPAASELNPELDAHLTLEPVRAVLKALRSRPKVSLTYLSSGGTVYGEPKKIPVDENHPTNPRGSYGKLHLTCESDVVSHIHKHGLQARILRCSTVYGEHQRPDRGQGAIATFLYKIERSEPIDLYGTTIRDYIYAGDVARVCIELLGRGDGPSVLNLASGKGTSLDSLLRLTEAQVGRQAQVVSHPERDFDIHEVILDIRQLRHMLDFRPTPLEVGIAKTHQWLTTAVLEAA